MAMTRKTLALVTTAWLVAAAVVPGQAPSKKDAPSRAELRQAMAKAHDLRQRIGKLQDQGAKDAAEEEFRRLVIKYHASFPEVAAAPANRARYSRLTMNARGGGCDAVRFRVPSAGRTYQLFWSFVVPGHLDTLNLATLNILPVEGEGLILTYPDVRDDVKVAGLNLPEANHWCHYRLYGRKLQAGQEYLLWFDLKADEPLPAFMRVRVEPIEPAEPPQTPALRAARGTFQSSLEQLNKRYDGDAKALRRKYLGDIGKASRAVPKKNAAEARALLAEADRANLGDSEAGDPRGFRVLRAEIGEGERWNDVTVPVRGLVRENRAEVRPGRIRFQARRRIRCRKDVDHRLHGRRRAGRLQRAGGPQGRPPASGGR